MTTVFHNNIRRYRACVEQLLPHGRVFCCYEGHDPYIEHKASCPDITKTKTNTRYSKIVTDNPIVAEEFRRTARECTHCFKE